VLAHGLSAAPLVSRYAGWYLTAADERSSALENQPAHQHRVRRPAALRSRDP
jgi:hypothetical protein